MINVVYALVAERCDADGLARFEAVLAEPVLTTSQRRRSAQHRRRALIAAAGGEVLAS